MKSFPKNSNVPLISFNYHIIMIPKYIFIKNLHRHPSPSPMFPIIYQIHRFQLFIKQNQYKIPRNIKSSFLKKKKRKSRYIRKRDAEASTNFPWNVRQNVRASAAIGPARGKGNLPNGSEQMGRYFNRKRIHSGPVSFPATASKIRTAGHVGYWLANDELVSRGMCMCVCVCVCTVQDYEPDEDGKSAARGRHRP